MGGGRKGERQEARSLFYGGARAAWLRRTIIVRQPSVRRPRCSQACLRGLRAGVVSPAAGETPPPTAGRMPALHLPCVPGWQRYRIRTAVVAPASRWLYRRHLAGAFLGHDLQDAQDFRLPILFIPQTVC